MVLWVHSDGAYLIEPNAKSRVREHYFLSNFIIDITKVESKLNDLVYIICEILKNIISSIAEYKIATAFENRQDTIVICRTLIKIGYHQLPTPIQVNNTTAK